MRSRYKLIKFLSDKVSEVVPAGHCPSIKQRWHLGGKASTDDQYHRYTLAHIALDCYGNTWFSLEGIQRTDIPLDSFFKLRDSCVVLLKKKELTF